MGSLDWPEILAFLTSVGFGVLSAIFPLANAETYVIASQVSSVAGIIPVAVGVSVGQTIGKLTLFLGVRRGTTSHVFDRQRQRLRATPVSPMRQRFRRVMRRLLKLVGTKRWGLPIVFLASVVGLPPLYAVALLAGATSMKPLWFALVVLVGRLTRFLLVALGGGNLHFW